MASQSMESLSDGTIGNLMIKKEAYIIPGYSFAINTIMEFTDGKKRLEQYKFVDSSFRHTKIRDVSIQTKIADSYRHTLPSGKTYTTQIDNLGRASLAIYDENLTLLNTLESTGALVGTVDKKWLLFDDLHAVCVDEKEKGNHIMVKSIEENEMTLVHRLNCDVTFGKKDWVRACGHPNDDMIAVVLRESQKLNIFNIKDFG